MAIENRPKDHIFKTRDKRIMVSFCFLRAPGQKKMFLSQYSCKVFRSLGKFNVCC
jgi:hypothetical protein